MRFDPLLMTNRFGLGAAPHHALPGSVAEMLEEARGTDPLEARYPALTTAEMITTEAEATRLRRATRQARGTAEHANIRDEFRAVLRGYREASDRDFQHRMIRYAATPIGLRQRLHMFWADHFAAVGPGGVMRNGTPTLLYDAIRPHIMGRFPDMLRAVVRHPIMIRFLDQDRSFGTNSERAQQRRRLGLNENLARELLELHTLGVGADYTQTDVRELAELLTGITFERGQGFAFRGDAVEPGPETVLGRTYDGGETIAALDTIDRALEDIALHPATAKHLAWKFARHFVSDTPDAALMAELEAVYAQTRGDLGLMMETLLNHPAAQTPERRNVKWPELYLASGLRALGLDADAVGALARPQLQRWVRRAMGLMGQPWHRPPDPAGFPEADAEWVTPQAVAARINWAMQGPERLTEALPDPRELLSLVAGREVPPALDFAVNAAETREVGVGLVLASPTFQRV